MPPLALMFPYVPGASARLSADRFVHPAPPPQLPVKGSFVVGGTGLGAGGVGTVKGAPIVVTLPVTLAPPPTVRASTLPELQLVPVGFGS